MTRQLPSLHFTLPFSRDYLQSHDERVALRTAFTRYGNGQVIALSERYSFDFSANEQSVSHHPTFFYRENVGGGSNDLVGARSLYGLPEGTLHNDLSAGFFRAFGSSGFTRLIAVTIPPLGRAKRRNAKFDAHVLRHGMLFTTQNLFRELSIDLEKALEMTLTKEFVQQNCVLIVDRDASAHQTIETIRNAQDVLRWRFRTSSQEAGRERRCDQCVVGATFSFSDAT